MGGLIKQEINKRGNRFPESLNTKRKSLSPFDVDYVTITQKTPISQYHYHLHQSLRNTIISSVSTIIPAPSSLINTKGGSLVGSVEGGFQHPIKLLNIQGMDLYGDKIES